MSAIRKSVISEVVYDHLTQMLYDGVFPPGSPINRKELADRMGVSPTPVGEAIARLLGEGIIEQVGKGGYRIKEFSYENLRSLYEVRAGLEGVAIRLCIEHASAEVLKEICACFDDFFDIPPLSIDINRYMKADQMFHRLIVTSCYNPYIINYNRSYEFLLRSYQRGLLRRPEDTIEEHRQIIDAIKSMDSRTAEFRMIEHHMATSRNIDLEHLSQATNRQPGPVPQS